VTVKIIRHQDLDAEQRIDDRALYAPLREHRNTETVWPLLEHEMPSACNQNCTHGRACDCAPAVEEDELDMGAGMGAVVVPVVIAGALVAAAAVAMIGGWL